MVNVNHRLIESVYIISNIYSKRNKIFILLRSRLMAIALCFALLLCSFALPASAAGLDYNDYITNIVVDGENDIVTVSFPFSGTRFTLRDVAAGTEVDYFGNNAIADVVPGRKYNLGVAPSYGDSILLDNIPEDTVLNFHISIDQSSWHFIDVTNISYSCTFMFLKSNGGYLGYSAESVAVEGPGYNFSRVLSDVPEGAESFYAYFYLNNFAFNTERQVVFTVDSYTLTMSISSLYRLQQQTGKTNEILSAVEKQLAEQGKTLDEVLQQQQQTNDKLDDMQGSIETLPGQIGDEMQGIIDNEKEESKGEGNKFVDQILDALPDPSTDVLAALKGLTDATAYTGTDAVLPIPAIVLPGIDGLFPQTEIWGGTQFDFGEYIGMLPPALLTLVQSLFSIAIVLYCVYELKGIISYCLTLRENKGG